LQAAKKQNQFKANRRALARNPKRIEWKPDYGVQIDRFIALIFRKKEEM